MSTQEGLPQDLTRELSCWAALIYMRLDPIASGFTVPEDPAMVAAEFGLPDAFVDLASESLDRNHDGLARWVSDLQDRTRLEGRIFEMMTDGFDGETGR